VGQGSRIHLKRNPGDTAQRLAVTNYLLGHFIRTANQQRAVRTSLRISGTSADAGRSPRTVTRAVIAPNITINQPE
jgi:hypothetical protein